MAKRRIWGRVAAVLIALVIAVIFSLLNMWQDGGGLRNWFGHKIELKVYDSFFKLRGPIETAPQVVIAAIDDKAIDQYGAWGSWDRRLIAQAIRNLRQAGAEIIAFDIVFSNPSQGADTQKGREMERVIASADLEGTAAFLAHKADATQAALKNVADGIQKSRLPDPIAAQLPDASRAAHQSGAAAALAGVEDARREVGLGKERILSLTGKTQLLLDMIRGESAGKTGDDEMAAAIEDHSGNLVLGFIPLLGTSDPKLLANAAELFEQIKPSAIDGIGVGWQIPKEGEEVGQPTYSDDVVVDARLRTQTAAGFVVPLKTFTDAAQMFGYFDILPDVDGVMRYVPLVFRYENKLVPSLALATASQMLECPAVPFRFPEDVIHPNAIQAFSFAVSDDRVKWICQRRLPGGDEAAIARCIETFGSPRLKRSQVLSIPTTAAATLYINYYGPENTTFKRISLADVIANTFDPQLVRGKVVIAAATAIGTFDQRVTPFDPFAPGVEVHAAAIQNILDGQFMSRPTFAGAIEVGLMLFFALFLAIALQRLNIAGGIVLTFVLVGVYLLINALVLFRHGYWFWTVFPTLQIFFTWAGLTVFGYLTEGRDKRRIASQFGKYVAPEYVKRLIENPEVIGMPGEERELTVLFSDIRGFTTMSERLAPEELTRFLNEYLTPMTYVLQRHGGTLDKYMGDAIMAFFGAPNPLPDHPLQGCMTAIEMLQELDRLRQKWRTEGKPELDIGIGLNTGKMRVGDMGSEAMRNYTVLGDNVNLGSRLEGLNKEYGTNTIVSEATFRAAGGTVFGRELDFVAVKGKREPVRIFELMGLGAPSDWQRNLTATFEQGLAAYRKQEWDGAIELFRKCLLLKKEATGQPDKTSHTYLERVRVLQQSAPGADWDGVWRMTKK